MKRDGECPREKEITHKDSRRDTATAEVVPLYNDPFYSSAQPYTSLAWYSLYLYISAAACDFIGWK